MNLGEAVGTGSTTAQLSKLKGKKDQYHKGRDCQRNGRGKQDDRMVAIPPSDQIEPKIRWAKSKARELLYADIIDGKIPLDKNDKSMKLKEIYNLCPEFKEYSYKKFSSRLRSLQKIVIALKNRAKADQEAYQNFIENHQPSLFTHKGYIQWQGSKAQEKLKEDMEAGLHESMEKKELYESRPEYFENFPLDQFRDKISQETKTKKYLNYLKSKNK